MIEAKIFSFQNCQTAWWSTYDIYDLLLCATQ